MWVVVSLRSSRANLQLIVHPSGMRNPSRGKGIGVFSVGYGTGIGINKWHEMNPRGLRAVTMFLCASVVFKWHERVPSDSRAHG